jgi:hypothetical protein
MAMTDSRGLEDTPMQRQRVTGTLGVVVTLAVAVILGVHPFGSTGLYDDGPRFVDHVGPLWIVVHLAGAILLLAVPVVIAGWAETLGAAAGHVFGRLTATVSVVAAALAVLHLVGTDTMTLPVAIATMSVASVAVTVVERQWTTLSEMGLLRPAITLFLVWFGLTSYRLRHRPAVESRSPTTFRSSVTEAR